jgi:4a-hydroxytetrahydrobiopterin dehydratase
MPIPVILYTRANCSLCDKARAAMTASGAAIELTEIDIDRDATLRARYTNDVPVVLIDGKEAFRHHVDPAAFASAVLAAERCEPCRGGVPPLATLELDALARDLGGGWTIVDGHHLQKEVTFPDFASALAFTNRVGAIAEEEGHHPDLHQSWGKVGIEIWTHAAGGLTRSDFVLAAKIDAIR